MPKRACWFRLILTLTLVVGGRLAAQNVTEMYVTPDTLRLSPGERQGLTVQAFDDAGNVILALRYRAADPSIAQVASNGTVTGGRAGETRILVQAGRKTRTVPVLVADSGTPPPAVAGGPAAPSIPISRVALDPASLFLLPTETGRATLRAVGPDGAPVIGVRVQWRSLNPAIVSVDEPSGLITGIATGQGLVRATVPGGPVVDLPVTVSLTNIVANQDRVVLSPDELDTLAITVPAQGGRRLNPADLQWSTSDGAVATVSADGVVRAMAPGRADLVVHGFLQELRIPVMVHLPIARFAVAPTLSEPVRLPVQSSRDFTLIPQTIDSLPIEGIPVTWAVADTTVATFDPVAGRLLARRPGRTTLQFSVRGFVPKQWAVEVLPGTVALARTRLALRPGERIDLAPQYTDVAGKPIAPATGLSWITSNADVARVTPEGAVEAVAPGHALITAQAPGGAPSVAKVFVGGDLLVASSRIGGHFGVYALLASRPESLFPLMVDSTTNSIDPSYSPDHTRIAFSSDRGAPGNFDIFVADADGENAVRLTSDRGMDLQPVWTPDGERIVFVSTRSGTRQVYVMRADGTGVRALTSLAGGAEQPAVSPDGKTVAFAGYPGGRDGQSDIYVVALDGGTPTAVTGTADRREIRPAYQENGSLAWIALRRDRREPDQVMRLSPGGAPTPLLSSDQTLVDFALAPDGSRLAWVSSHPQDHNPDALEFTFQWRTLSSGTDTRVRLLPGERITSPAF